MNADPKTSSGQTPDPIIDEVRDARRQLDEAHGGDIRRHVAALQARQQASDRRIIPASEDNPARRVG